MKKIFNIIIIFMMFFAFSLKVDAKRGDLLYQVDSVTLNDSYITFKGWAFIHQTNNYATVYKLTENGTATSEVVKNNGGQKVIIKVSNASGDKVKTFESTPGNDDYNFYYQMYTWDSYYGPNTYNNADMNECGDRCYYEDLGFNIKVPIEELFETFSSEEKLYLYIAAYNNDYGKTTSYEELRVVSINGSSNYIEIEEGIPNGEVKFIGVDAKFQALYEQRKYCKGVSSYCTSVDAVYGNTGSYYHILKSFNEQNYVNGFYAEPLNGCPLGSGGKCFLQHTYSPGKFVFCVDKNNGSDACATYNNGYCTSCKSGAVKLAAYGSWIQFNGQFVITTIPDKKCEPEPPTSGNLECNVDKTYNSTCDELTIHTDKGTANVKIEQIGNISSVLTPENIFEGGGINFGIIYTNTIKWSYVDGIPSNAELRSAVNTEMNNKLKDYNSYVAGLNITELKLKYGNSIVESFDDAFLVKKCSSNSNLDYYGNDGLTVSCIFYVPSSNISLNGNVEYTNGSVGSGISNKYYFPFGKYGNYEISAKIVGMDRIKLSSSREDMDENTIPANWGNYGWTGNWSNSLSNCIINVYPLFYNSDDPNNNNSLTYNFIYRPINIYNPFPNRNAGINWYDWYRIESNKEKLENTYSNLEYSAVLNTQTINNIKDYNKSHNYLEWDIDKNTEKSSFITENSSYIVRGGGN